MPDLHLCWTSESSNMGKVNIFSTAALPLLLLLLASFSSAVIETKTWKENSTQATGRSARKNYDVVYSPPDNYVPKKSSNFFSPDDANDEIERSDEPPNSFQPSNDPKSSEEDSTPPQTGLLYAPPSYDEFVPVPYYSHPRPRYFRPGPDKQMYKSASSVNWNVWKGDQIPPMPPATPPPMPDSNKGGPPLDFGDYYFPTDSWKGDPWTPDQMSTMMMMMNQMQGNKPKFGGFLSKLAQDPGALMIAIVLPFSLLLAAVLPTLVNMMMNGGLPTVTTVASGNNGRSLEGAEYLSPVIHTITTFGARSFDNPDCMQRIFCQVTRGPSTNGTEPRSFQKALYTASRLIDSSWLENFGVKTLFDTMADGDCDKIPCSESKTISKSGKSKKS